MFLYDSDCASSMAMAEALRAKIENLTLACGPTLTASLGVSCLKPGITWKDWMKECDENMYLAKSNGRNQVVG